MDFLKIPTVHRPPGRTNPARKREKDFRLDPADDDVIFHAWPADPGRGNPVTPSEEMKMIGSLTYIAARKQSDGSYALVYRGTSNEVFPGMRWPNAATARMHAKVEKARAAVRAEYATAGLDADVEIDGFDTMTADQLADEITYLGDYQG